MMGKKTTGLSSLLSFDAVCREEGTLNRLPPRLTAVDVRRIVGSVDAVKVASLPGTFQPYQRRGRYEAVYAAMRDGVALPPIEVYALRGAYYVVDGHHRVAAALALDYPYLDAVVHEFLLPPTSPANRLHNEQLTFARATGLTEIIVSDPGAYRLLLDQIREHAHYLAGHGRPLPLTMAAADWREYVYTPVTEWLAASGVPRRAPTRTLADLYVDLCAYKWEQSRARGMDIGFPKALADVERRYLPPAAGTALSVPLQALRGLAAAIRGVHPPAAPAAGEGATPGG
ncbi:MAG: DUF4032 domain-containing protein [Chloroflexota bacterium]